MDVSQFITDVRNVVTILAIVLGGVWGYYKFVRGRIFRMRVDLSLSGCLHHQAKGMLLVLSYSVRNVGTTKFEMEQKGSAVR